MVIKLSESNINNAIKEIINLKADIQDANGQIVSNLVEYGVNLANMYNNSVPHSSAEIPAVKGDVDTAAGKGSIALIGDGAVYDEFGTGEEGADDGHPWKYMFPLNPYNSGPYVSTHINENGRHYWIIPPDVELPNNGYVRDDGYTEGIPSGKQMYNTAKGIREKQNEIIIKKLNDATARYRR